MLKNVVRRFLVSLGKVFRSLGVQIPERIFRHLHFKGTFTLALPGGECVKLYSWGNRVENELAWRGWNGHEAESRERWVQMLARPGDVLDIGANTGTFAFTAKSIRPSARVIAFEPIQRIAARISHNVSVSGLQVEIVEAAVADYPGQLPIYDPGGANAYSASLEKDFLTGSKEVYSVPVVTVDAYCAQNNLEPTTIKIDAEGSEARVLLGARNILRKRKTLILCEWLGNSEEHVKAANLIKEVGFIAVDLSTLAEIDATQTAIYGERNILIGPPELIRALPNWI